MKISVLLLCVSVAGAWVGPDGWFAAGPRFTGFKNALRKFNPQSRFLEWTSAMSADSEDLIGDALVELFGPKDAAKPAPAPAPKPKAVAAATKPAPAVATSFTVARAEDRRARVTKVAADLDTSTKVAWQAGAEANAKTAGMMKIATSLQAAWKAEAWAAAAELEASLQMAWEAEAPAKPDARAIQVVAEETAAAALSATLREECFDLKGRARAMVPASADARAARAPSAAAASAATTSRAPRSAAATAPLGARRARSAAVDATPSTARNVPASSAASARAQRADG